MGRRFKREGKGKKRGGGKLSQKDLDYLAKNTSMSEESIRDFYQVIGLKVLQKTPLRLRKNPRILSGKYFYLNLAKNTNMSQENLQEFNQAGNHFCWTC